MNNSRHHISLDTRSRNISTSSLIFSSTLPNFPFNKLANIPNTKLSSSRPRLNSHSKGRLSNKPISLLN